MSAARTGDSLGDMILGMLPTATRHCLARCAVPPSFDADTFTRLLGGEDGPDLAELVQAGQVKPYGPSSDRFAVSELLREPALAHWWSSLGPGPAPRLPIPAELARLAELLAEQSRTAERPLDRLELSVLGGPELAADTFTELFQAADDRHDLPLCRAILDIVDAPERRPLQDGPLAERRDEAALLLRSRSMWTTAFYESARYVARPVLEQPLDDLLAGDSGRVLQLYGDGGMGKTMQIRWLIARRCARRDDRTVCVRLDFDAIHPVTAARRPWLLLVEIAAQLDPQLSGGPFKDFLADFRHYRGLLDKVPSGTTAPVSLPNPGPSDEVAAEVRFFDVLAELSTQQRMLVVLDTLEEAVGPAMDAISIFRLVRRLLDAPPALRVLLAGRWDLRGRVPGIETVLPELTNYAVPPLTVAEQDRYLTEVRGITSPEIVAEVVRLSEGRPLTMAAYANLVKQSDQITAAVLASFATPGLLYALGRVVERISSDRLQWLVRYGVVPRKLSFDFVASVLPTHLRSGMAGTSTLDDPKLDDRPHDRREIFRTGIVQPDDELDLRELWDQLLGYAEEQGWVSVQSDDRQLVAFRQEVLDALRRLLREHPVHRTLQQHAADYYEGASRDRPELRREAIYHHFQVDYEAGLEAWRAAVRDARAAGDDEICLDLATDLLGRDYVDWTGRPLNGFGFQLVAEAQLERARAAAGLAGRQRGSAHNRWSDVEEGLSAALELAERSDVELPAAALRVLQAQLLTIRGEVGEVAQLLSDDRQSLAGAERAESELALGRSLAATEPAAACEHLDIAYVLSRDTGDVRGARAASLLLAETENSRSRYAEALAAFDRAEHDGILDLPSEEFSATKAWSLLQSGRPLRAAQVADELMTVSSPYHAYWYVLRALCRYAADDLLGALADCDQAIELMAESSEQPAFGMDHAVGIRGLALGALYGLPSGTDDLLSAAARCRSLRNLSDAAHYTALAGNVLIRDVGDLREAQQCVEEARQVGADRGSDGWVYGEVMAIRLAARLGRTGRANKIAGELRTALDAPGVAPSVRAEALVAALGVADASQLDELLARLSDELSGMSPPGARIEALNGLDQIRRLPATSQRALNRLVEQVREAVDEESAEQSGAERARLLARLAEVLRVAGYRHEAIEPLHQARAAATDPLSWWRWLLGMERLGTIDHEELEPPDDGLDGMRRQFPLLTAAYRITLAERRLSVDVRSRTRARLEPVRELLARVGRHTMWHARLAEIEAQLAREVDDHFEATHRAAEAARIYSRLGDQESQKRVAGTFELGEPSWHDDQGTVELTLQLDAGEIVVYSGQANDESSPSLTIPRAELDPSSTDWRAAFGTATASGGWWDIAGDLGRRVLPPSLRNDLAAAGPDGLELRLVPRASDLGALPWELIRLDADAEMPLVSAPGIAMLYRSLPRPPREEAKVRALQIGLNRLGHFDAVPDGYFGKRTRDALAAFQTEARLPLTAGADRVTWQALSGRLLAASPPRQLRVLVLAPGSGGAYAHGDAAWAGEDVVAAYARANVRVQVLRTPSLEQVWQLARSELRAGVDVVHICATPRTTSGSTVLDFGGESSRPGERWTRSAELSVTAVGELLSTLSPDVFSPSVIVDAPQPRTSAEIGRILLARNAFAYQLLRLGRVPAVLATGLAAPHQKDELSDALIRGLTLDHTFPAAARRVWDRHIPRAGDDLRAVLPFATTALFLQRPPVTMLPLILA